MKKLALLLATVLLLAAAPAGSDPAGAELPLGRPRLPEMRATEELAPGVWHTRIDRGEPGSGRWFVDVAVVTTRSEADAIAAALRDDRYDAEVIALERAPDDPRSGPSGFVVRSGDFATQVEADARVSELRVQGYSGARSAHTALVGEPTDGPFVVHVLEIDPELFEGTVVPALATDVVPGRERVTDIVRRTGALAGINASYFVIGEADGTPGDLAGISVVDGALVSEAVNGRTALVVRPHDGADVATLDTSLGATIDRRAFTIDGLNRDLGEIRSCGGVGGDLPTEDPRHDFTCTDDSEVILYEPVFGTATPAGPGVEAVVGRSGRIVAVRGQRGGPIPGDGAVLAATGQSAATLAAVADVGDPVRITESVTESGRRVPVGDRVGVVNGGPRLLEAGGERVTAFAEGFVWPDDPAFYYRFGLARHPRTIAGVTADARLLLVTIDGRHLDHSAGATFIEEAGVMRALGAIEAVNLDGGGSTTFVIDGQLVNRPSDTTGERPVGDALLLFE